MPRSPLPRRIVGSYGANTMGGVINIITRRGTVKPTTDLTASFGDYDTKNLSVSHGGSHGVVNYWLNYSFRESDGVRLSDDFDPNGKFGVGTETDEDGGKIDGSDYTKQSVNAKIGFLPSENTQAYLTLNYIKNEKGIPNNDWHFEDWQQYQISLVGEHRVNENLRLKARSFYVDHKDSLKMSIIPPRTGSSNRHMTTFLPVAKFRLLSICKAWFCPYGGQLCS